MSRSDLDPCVIVVSGNPAPGPVSQLPTTGADFSSVPWIVVAGAVVLIVGVLLVAGARGRRRSRALSALVTIAVVLGVVAGTVPASSSQAAARAESAQQCSLFALSDVQRGASREAGALLPGQNAEVLALRVTNVTTASIVLRVSLAPTGGDASSFVADIAADSAPVASGVLAQSPATAPLSLEPGQRLDLQVLVGVPSDADHVGATSTFDTILTATSG